MALVYTNVIIEIREISLRDRPQELYAASKKGTVPVLITTENKVIDESLEIMMWALENSPNQTWLSNDSSEEMDLIKENDTTFKKWLDRYKYHDRHPENPREYYRDYCDKILSNYESRLNSTTYFIRDDISVADIAIFPFVRQFANVDYPWFEGNYKQLVVWLNNMQQSELFVSIISKYDIWNKENNSTILDYEQK